MGPEGNILVNSLITTFQQSLTHSALGWSVCKNNSKYCRDDAHQISGSHECHHHGAPPKVILWSTFFQSFYSDLSGQWSPSVGQQTDPTGGLRVIHEVSDFSCLQPNGTPLPCRCGPVVWPQGPAGLRWHPPSWTCRGWQALSNSLQSNFIHVDFNIIDLQTFHF